jgi:hypothetical protein
MAKREIDYGNLTVAKEPPSATIQDPPAATQEPEELTGPSKDGEYLKDVAQSVLLYISPEAHKQLLLYTAEQSSHRNRVRVHDCLIEALETWFETKGLPGPVRAKERPKPGQGRGRR